jgi:hypothetical protein
LGPYIATTVVKPATTRIALRSRFIREQKALAFWVCVCMHAC